MISDEVKLYTKIAEIDEAYNFVVDKFLFLLFTSSKIIINYLIAMTI
jgi:hypothetical protein